MKGPTPLMLVLSLAVPLAGAGCIELDAPTDPVFPPGEIEGRLVVTTTDFSTGGLTIFDLGTRSVERDVAIVTSDAVPVVHDDRIYVINRFMFDHVDVRDPAQNYASSGVYSVDTDRSPSANPHGLAFDAGGLGYLTLYGAGEVAVFDFERDPIDAELRRIDLTPWADDDGIAEACLALAAQGRVFVSAQRRDREANFTTSANDVLLAIDEAGEAVQDAQEMPFAFARQWRADPDDDGAVLLLAHGVHRVDLSDLSVEAVVSEMDMAAAGIEDPLLPQAFDVHGDGERIYFSAYTSDYGEVRLWSARAGEVPQLLGSAGNSVERVLEVAGDELWVGDTTLGASGLRGFAIGVDGLDALAEGALSTGLAPYSMVMSP